jgi:hypothetical protein
MSRDPVARKALAFSFVFVFCSWHDRGWITLADTDDPRRKQIELSQTAPRAFLQTIGVFS